MVLTRNDAVLDRENFKLPHVVDRRRLMTYLPVAFNTFYQPLVVALGRSLNAR